MTNADRSTNFKLCLKCQTVTTESIRKEPKESRYDKFIHVVNERAECGEMEFVAIKERLNNLTAQKLKEAKAVWHVKCYSDATNQTNIKRAKMRHEKAISLKDATMLKKQKGRPPIETANLLEGIKVHLHLPELLVPNYRNMTNQPVGKMKKLKLDDWNAGCKTWKSKTVCEDITLKTSNSMMTRLLVLTRSSRDMDLKEIIEKY